MEIRRRVVSNSAPRSEGESGEIRRNVARLEAEFLFTKYFRDTVLDAIVGIEHDYGLKNRYSPSRFARNCD